MRGKLGGAHRRRRRTKRCLGRRARIKYVAFYELLVHNSFSRGVVTTPQNGEPKMNIEELTFKQIRELQSLFGSAPAQPQVPHPLTGCNVIARTVTMIFTGKLVEVTPTDLVLKDCSWIPQTARYASFVSSGAVQECEPYPDGLSVYINRSAMLDLCELKANLPRMQK